VAPVQRLPAVHNHKTYKRLFACGQTMPEVGSTLRPLIEELGQSDWSWGLPDALLCTMIAATRSQKQRALLDEGVINICWIKRPGANTWADASDCHLESAPPQSCAVVLRMGQRIGSTRVH
jgi:hypothetical protein